ncbi:DUF2515 family protein [Metabacillus sp. Hm71]|uniref:DUF2515 family protein n=1 Tax=Metabacillus sp. Hm71 TaxID=3450743 RepID=UPI003F41D279
MYGMAKLFNLQQKKTNEASSISEDVRHKLYNDLYETLTHPSPIITNQNERKLIRYIQRETEKHNVNNITRTKAYLQFFNRHKEIHWALLAHMVSRNGGYNMTDLKSSLIGRFLADKEKEKLFHFLERANALIFQDAYPQLLLYEISKRENTSLFHLLPALRITKFMIPVWEHFLLSSNSQLLTLALITNEQQYVEKHLINFTITKKIFKTFTYVMQEKLGLTHVIFPYKRYPFLRNYSLAGIEVRDFSSVQERIKIGKQLYSILFSKLCFDSIVHFANHVSHTASRSDYWPHFFSKQLKGNRIIYSPSLLDAWDNVSHHFSHHLDWFTDITLIKGFERGMIVENGDLTKEVKHDLHMLATLGKLTPIQFPEKKKR